MKKVYLALGLYALYAFYNYRNQSPLDSSSSVLTDVLANLGGNKMQTSQAGKAAITTREGERFDVYLDDAGLPTCGIGHKLRPADGSLSFGDTVGADTVAAWFASDVQHAENIVNRYVTVPLSQNEFDALVSIVFNAGSALFINHDGSDTGIYTALKNADYSGAASQILRWVYIHVNGVAVVSNGLYSRRLGEQQQFLA